MWSIPTLLLAIILGFVLGTGFGQLLLAIGLSTWVDIARIVRGQVLQIKTLPYIEATKALGFQHTSIMYRHILPNLISPLIVMAIANFGSAVLIESGLSFLGLGVELGTPTWGRMVFEGYPYLLFEEGKGMAIFPGIVLIALVMSINLAGNGVRDAWNLAQTRSES
jgi:peptide/nickel transport system permease protein